MPVYVSPGVYAREIDLSQYAPSLATSILAILGGAHKGTPNEATLITNEADLINTFGIPTSDSFLVYAGMMFLQQGKQLRVVRVTDGTEASAKIDIAGLAQPAFHICSKDLSRGVDLSVLTTVKIMSGATTKEINLTTGWAGDIHAVSIRHIISRLNHVTDGIPGISSQDWTGAYIVLHSTTTGATSFVQIQNTTTPALNASPIVFGVNTYTTQYDGKDAIGTALTISANSPGDWAENYGIEIGQGTETGTFKIGIYDFNGNYIEELDNLDMSSIENDVNNKSRFIIVDDHNQAVPPSPFLFYSPTAIASKRYFLSGGLNGISSLSDADYIGTYTGGLPTGLQVLSNPESLDINIIACPGISSGAVILEMLRICQSRADCMCIVDPPMGLTNTEVTDWHNGAGTWAGLHPAFNSSYGAVYWSWVEIYDAYNAKRVFIPPSCLVAAQYAYNDYIGEVWDAPAGLTRGRFANALRLEFSPDQGQRDAMYSGGNVVNPLVDFPRDGITIWGQRTLQRTPSALDRVNVRRLLLYIEKVISTVARIIVFEPNNDKTWRRLTGLIEPVLNSIKARGGLEGYEVRIDSTTTTDYEKNRNMLSGKIFLIPTKTAEIIQLDFIVLPSGASFSEI